jgi:hypothetical protein
MNYPRPPYREPDVLLDVPLLDVYARARATPPPWGGVLKVSIAPNHF